MAECDGWGVHRPISKCELSGDDCPPWDVVGSDVDAGGVVLSRRVVWVAMLVAAGFDQARVARMVDVGRCEIARLLRRGDVTAVVVAMRGHHGEWREALSAARVDAVAKGRLPSGCDDLMVGLSWLACRCGRGRAAS